MWLYDSGHGYTQKCVVIRLVRLLLRRQPATSTSRWLYVLARGYMWLYFVHVPHSLQVHIIDVHPRHYSALINIGCGNYRKQLTCRCLTATC